MSGLFCNLTYEQVVHKFAQTVTSVCIMRLQNYADAEDCFQNTFLHLYTSSPDFNSEEHLKAWLIRVAINECNSLLRKIRRLVPLDKSVMERIYFTEDENDISWALMKLSSPYREVVYLYYCEEYKVEEIAQILGKNKNTVKTLLKRGREKLKTIYGGEGD